MTAEQQAMMTKLQQVGLTMDDLRIYLDTHPEDTFALERFNMAADDYPTLMEDYGEQFGPLTGTCSQYGNDAGWLWGSTDFPWQY